MRPAELEQLAFVITLITVNPSDLYEGGDPNLDWATERIIDSQWRIERGKILYLYVYGAHTDRPGHRVSKLHVGRIFGPAEGYQDHGKRNLRRAGGRERQE